MSVRQPSVAGQFYSASKAALEKELAGLIDKDAEKTDCLGAVSPHAGYIYSGMVAGRVLSRIKFKESFVILGPNHTGIGEPFAIQSSGYWQTPTGKIAIDETLAKGILKNSRFIKEDVSAHAHEHSIEVQLPILQHINKEFKFIPIIISHAELSTYREIGRELADSIKRSNKNVVLISSSDMTHYESQESAKNKDKKAIDAILKLDEENLMEEIQRWDISMCGYAPTIVMLSCLKQLGARKAELVDYKTSGDTSGDYTSVVGYAGILIK
ncbi:MAG: AmmeMemoRadiSam system protein B [Candidatus Omnitrophica bacterium]|nr:AmmeMemoRadiSam system protein B [Candidatus Omnitrophota bacterium]